MPDSVDHPSGEAHDGTIEPAVDAADLLSALPDAPTTPEAKSSDPWANSPWDAPTQNNLKRLPDKVITKEEAAEKPAWQVREERKEAITEAHLSVTLDRAAIKRVVDNHPELLGEQPSSSMFDKDGSKAAAEREVRRADLQATADALAALPEHLDFQPGITLVFGENGLGKSTLAKSLRFAAEIQDRVEDDMFGEPPTLEEARKQVLTKSGSSISTESVATEMSGMAPFIAGQISVDTMASYGHLRYYDAAQIMGQLTEQVASDAMDYRLHSQIDVGAGRSHRQTIDGGLFDFVANETNKALAVRSERAEYEARGEEIPRRLRSSNEGPQLYFFDEPEVGMSPLRQRQLIDQLNEITYPGSVIIVPTNSILMYDSDLPRIDLEHPERGIFKPSDYPDDED